MFKQQIRDYLSDKGLSQQTLSKKIGISNGALSAYLSGNYKTPEALEVKIDEFFKMVSVAQEISTKRPDFIHTSIADVVLNAISYCHIQKSMGIVYGDAGIGKTMSIKEYESKHIEAVTIRASFAISKPKAFLKALARKLKCSSATLQDEIYLDIVDKLGGSEKVIIIDEAQHLPYSTLENIRDLHDECEIGVVLIGNKEIYSKLLGKGEAAFAQLFSRQAIRKELTTTNIVENDIKLLFPHLDDESMRFLHSVARSRWGIRGAVYSYLNGVNNSDISAVGLRDVTKFMGIVV